MNTSVRYKQIRSAVIIILGLFAIIIASLLIATGNSILPFGLIAGIFLLAIALKSPFSVLVLISFLVPLENFGVFQGASLNRYLIPVLLVGWLGGYLLKRETPRLEWPVFGMAAWVALGLFSYLWAPTASRLVENVFGYFLALIILVASSNMLDSRRRLSWVVGALLAGQLLFMAIWFTSRQVNSLGFLMPSLGAGDVSAYGNLLGAVLACQIALLLYGRSWQRWLALLALMLGGYLFFAIGLRRIILSSAAVTLALLIFSKHTSWKAILLTLILGVGIWFSLNWVFPHLPLSIQQRFTMENASVSGASRLELSAIALNVWKAFPLLGAGLGSYSYYSAMSYSMAASAHNAFLEVLAETGLVGFALWCGAFFAVVYKSIKTFKAQDCHPEQLLAAIMLALMFFLLVNGIVGSFQTWHLLWLGMGVSIGAAKVLHPNIPKKQVEVQTSASTGQEA